MEDLRGSDVSEVEVQIGNLTVGFKRALPEREKAEESLGPGALELQAEAEVVETEAMAESQAAGSAAPAGAADNIKEIHAPLTGLFYRAADPNAPPLVEVGEVVKAGQTVGIIEAMKMFNEIKTQFAGKVVRVLAGNGQLVKTKEILMEIEVFE